MEDSMRLFFALLLPFVLTAACSQKPKTETAPTDTYQGLGTESVPAETIRKFAAGPVDPMWIARVQKLLDLRSSAPGVMSPDGKTMYYDWRVTGTSQVWRVEGALGYPRQMTAGQDRTSIVAVLPNGKDLIIARDRNGEENPGLYLQGAKGGDLRVVFHKKGVQARFAHVTADSRTIYFTANSESPESYAIHRYDIASGKDEVLFKEPGTWFVTDVLNDSHFMLAKATGSLWAEYSVWTPKDGKLVPLLGQGEKEEYDVAFGAHAGEYLVSIPKFGDFRRLYSFKNGKFTPVSPDVKKDLSAFVIDKARTRIYLNWNDRGYFRTEVLDARTGKTVASPTMKNLDHLTVARVSRDGRYAVYSAEEAKKPRMVYVKDWVTGSFRLWLDSSVPETDASKFAAVTLETYPARDGTPIPMFVRRPAKCDPAPCPVIIDFHGGPESQSTPGFSPYSQSFVDAGFVFIEPNVRGSDGYGKAWLASDDGPKRLKVITDIEDAAIYAKKTFAANGKAPKIGVMGGSYGGYSTLYAMTAFAGAYDAGVANVGMSNLISFLNNTAPYRRHLRISEYGDPVKDREALIQLSPVTHIDKTKGPLLIIQGVNDPRVPAGEAIQIYNHLQAKGLSSELILFADEGHGSAKRENIAITLAHTLRFFEKHLKEAK
jgi:dipeptidyl aminopeptidase/acylaminoacyl peptidase